MSEAGKTPPSSEITPERLYVRRREFLRDALRFSATTAGVGGTLLWLTGGGRATDRTPSPPGGSPVPLTVSRHSRLSTDEPFTREGDATTYNNFYEFGTGKDDPARLAHTLRTRPWAVEVEGEVNRPGPLDIDDLLRWFPLEERVYRLRCVEGWSMVIPWLGFPLAELIKRVEPTSRAKYVAFQTLFDRERMPGQRQASLEWPYVEGLRIDEAVHPLTLLAVGMYGKALPNQNGAPVRLVVPWKYGFKSIKSISRIRFTEQQPPTSWNLAAPREYGFYSNVNPDVDHPRWSQKTERRIGEFGRRPTLPFNGYAEQVADLYAGVDLRKFF